MPDPWNIVYCHRYNILIIKENRKTRSQCMWEISSSMGNSVNSLDVYSDSLFIQVLWRAAHLCGQLPVLFTNETSSNIVDTFVRCDPNMYS